MRERQLLQRPLSIESRSDYCIVMRNVLICGTIVLYEGTQLVRQRTALRCIATPRTAANSRGTSPERNSDAPPVYPIS